MTGRDDRDVFEYALVRVVPRVERGEMINAGVLVYCRARSFVGARTHLDEAKLRRSTRTADVGGGTGRAARPSRGSAHGGEAAGQAARDDAGAPVPLADRAPLDGRAARPRAHRPHRRPGGRGGPAARAAGALSGRGTRCACTSRPRVAVDTGCQAF